MRQRPETMIALTALLLAVPMIAPAQAPTSLTLNPATLTGGQNSTGQVTLAGPAPAGGLAIDLSSSNTAVATVPAGVGVLAGATTVGFTVTAKPVAQSTTVTINARAGGVTKTAQLTVVPPVLSSITLAAPSVYGGAGMFVEGQVKLSGRAPTGGLAVPLSSSDAAVAHVKTGFSVSAGETAGSFTVATSPVAQSTPATITATLSGLTRSAVLAVLPAIPDRFIVDPISSPLIGGQSRTRNVRLKGSAPSGGLLIQLLSSNTAVATVPANVTAVADATTVDIVVTAIPVAQATTATITATAGGVSVTGDVTVHPPVPSSVSFTPVGVVGGAGRTGQVSLNGPVPSGGLSVQLASSAPAAVTVPASVTVPAGATTKTFEATTIAVHSPVIVQITATAGSGTKSGSLTILPPVPTSLTLTPSSVLHGNSSTGQVTLNGPAPASGFEVQLSVSSQGVAVVPAAVIVPAGATTKSLPIQTNLFLPQSTTVTITASAGGVNVPAQLTVHP